MTARRMAMSRRVTSAALLDASQPQKARDEDLLTEPAPCLYCGGRRPQNPDHACDRYLGDRAGLYHEQDTWQKAELVDPDPSHGPDILKVETLSIPATSKPDSATEPESLRDKLSLDNARFPEAEAAEDRVFIERVDNLVRNPDQAVHRLSLFHHEEFGDIRVIDPDGEELWVANDVAAVAGYQNPRDAMARHCKGVVKRDILTAGGVQSLSMIPVADVFRLIMRPQLDDAVKLQDWVMEEVLPQIRKTGSYSLQTPRTMPEALRLAADAMERAAALETENLALDTRSQELVAEVQALETEVEAAKPKVEAFDVVMSAEGNVASFSIAGF